MEDRAGRQRERLKHDLIKHSLIIIGTGHVLKIHDAVFSTIVLNRPQVVAIELDAIRFESLITPPEERAKESLVGRVLAGYQEKLASLNGSYVGLEFLAASESARVLKIPLAFIDRRINITWRRLMQAMSPWEKVKAVFSILGGWLTMPFYAGNPSRLEEQVDEMTEHLDDYMDELARYLPGAKQILVDERNTVMAANIRRLLGEYGKVIAVVGDGHVEDLCRLLYDLKPYVVRLKALKLMMKGRPCSSILSSHHPTEFRPFKKINFFKITPRPVLFKGHRA